MKNKGIFSYIKIGILCLSVFVLMYCALVPDLRFWELDSYAMPIISMQYRGTMVIEEQDAVQLTEDMPELYQYANEERLYLVEVNDNQYISYYFPVYSFFVMFVKMFLQLIHANMKYCFSIANAIFFWLALFAVARKLKASEKAKVALMLLLLCGPALGYIRYCSAEVFIMSMIVISMAFHSSKCYKRSGLAITLAGMVQPVVMVLGFVYIADCLFNIYRENKPQNFIVSWLKSWKKLLALAACYIWVFVPFIYNYIMIQKGSKTAGMFMPQGWLSRAGAYMFDLNIGFLGYFPIAILAFIVVSVICIVKKKYRVVEYDLAFLGIVAIIAFIDNINCGMYMCARYVFWTAPVMFTGLVIGCDDGLKGKTPAVIMSLSVITNVLFTGINYAYYTDEVHFNKISSIVMTYAPALYSPHQTTFWVRSNQFFIDDTSGISSYSVFAGEDGYVRKMLVCQDEEQNEYLISCFKGSEEDINYIVNELNAVPNDGAYHYINISKFTGVDVEFYAN